MRSSRNSFGVGLLSAAGVMVVILSLSGIGAQFFDPKMDDKTYMDAIQTEVMEEVRDTKEELITQAKVIQDITRNYIAARLKQNLFKALRVLAEKELQLDAMSMQDRPRQPRQEDEEEETEAATTRRNSQVIPQVASLIKAVFGGNINLTSYVESAATFLPKPIGNQLVGVVKLLANNPGYKYTTTTTTTTTTTPTTPIPNKTGPGLGGPEGAPPKRPIGAGSGNGLGPGSAGSLQKPQLSSDQYRPLQTRRSTTTTEAEPDTPEPTEPTDEDEDSNEISKRGENLKKSNSAQRQLTIPGLDLLVNIGSRVSGILSGGNKNSNSNNKVAEEASNKTTSGFEEEAAGAGKPTNVKMNGIDVSSLAKEFRMGLGDLIKVMPDLFKGAHEAYKLINSVTSLFSRLEAEV